MAQSLRRLYKPVLYQKIWYSRRAESARLEEERNDDHVQGTSFQEKLGEDITAKRARLLYQSRRRGILENDLLLGTFFTKHMMEMTHEQLCMYDQFINEPTNDWDIFNWITEVKEPPEKYDNEILKMLIQHATTGHYTERLILPNL